MSVFLLWLSLVGVGILYLTDYSSRPGKAIEAQKDWPSKTRIQPDADKPTLLLIAHPQCSCTRASIGELEQIMARRQGSMKVYVLFYKPADMPDEWVKSDIWRSASAIPGLIVQADYDGVEARLFGAKTSGQTFLYDQKGRLIFQGGITAARGHRGDNKGRQAIESFIDTGTLPSSKQTPSFGCSLRSESLR